MLAGQVSPGQVVEVPSDGIGRPCNCQNNAGNSTVTSSPRSGIFGLGLMDRFHGGSEVYVPAES